MEDNNLTLSVIQIYLNVVLFVTLGFGENEGATVISSDNAHPSPTFISSGDASIAALSVSKTSSEGSANLCLGIDILGSTVIISHDFTD